VLREVSRRKEEGGRRKEEGGRRKEEGGRRKEEGGRYGSIPISNRKGDRLARVMFD
jgi:hypothetical protein